MLALAGAVREGRVPDAEIALVMSDHANAAGLSRAQELGLDTIAIERDGRSREDHDRAIVAALQKNRIEIVCLAGYMRLLSRYFIDAYPDRILNIHPSILPAFPGLDAHAQVLEHGVKWTGCTVHFVDEMYDTGPIILQRVCPVLDDDTPQTLAARLFEEEKIAYPEAIRLFQAGRLKVEGRRVRHLQ